MSLYVYRLTATKTFLKAKYLRTHQKFRCYNTSIEVCANLFPHSTKNINLCCRANVIKPGLPDGKFLLPKNYDLDVYFGGSSNGTCWYSFGHLAFLTAIRYILWPFGNFTIIRYLGRYIFPFWYIVTIKI
jgi:hypothetical protein